LLVVMIAWWGGPADVAAGLGSTCRMTPCTCLSLAAGTLIVTAWLDLMLCTQFSGIRTTTCQLDETRKAITGNEDPPSVARLIDCGPSGKSENCGCCWADTCWADTCWAAA